MSLTDYTVIEENEFCKCIQTLNLEEEFKKETGHELPETDLEINNIIKEPPTSVLLNVLRTSEEQYIYEPPETGSDPRYRIIHILGD